MVGKIFSREIEKCLLIIFTIHNIQLYDHRKALESRKVPAQTFEQYAFRGVIDRMRSGVKNVCKSSF